MDMIIFIGFVFLVIANIVLYHKIFNVIYFNLSSGLMKELVASIFVAIIEIAIVGAVGKWVILIAVIVGIALWIGKKK